MTDTTYKDTADVTHVYETVPGDAPGTENVVHTLPAAVLAHIAATADSVDGLETLVAATNTALATLGGHLDTVETKLQSIIDSQAPPSGGPKFGQNTSIGSGSDAQFTSQALSRGMVITNLDTTNNLLVSHQTGPTAAGATTRTVKPGMSTSFIACTNANAVYLRSSSGTIAACYDGV